MNPDLKMRALSAFVLAPVILWAVWQGGLALQFLLGTVIVLSAYEWARVTCRDSWLLDTALIAGTALGALQLAAMLDGKGNMMQLIYVAAAILSGMAFAGSFASMRGLPLLWRLLGVVYISLGPAAFIWLRGQAETGLMLTLWLLLLIWAMDTGAYFTGRAVGGPKLAPRASPNKTWAGLLGGMTSAGLVGVIFGGSILADVYPQSAFLMVIISAFIGAWSQAGDIAESMVKRHFGVKDMGHMIPGHGGILDRIDGLLFAAPMMAAWVLVLHAIGT
jgi:phosphatidate cytidylyltransferase